MSGSFEATFEADERSIELPDISESPAFKRGKVFPSSDM